MQSVGHLNDAELFEVSGSLYKLIIPIHENAHDYEALVKAYANLRGI